MWFIPSGPMCRCFNSKSWWHCLSAISVFLLINIMFIILFFYFLRVDISRSRYWIVRANVLKAERNEGCTLMYIILDIFYSLQYVHCWSELAFFVVVPERRLSCRLRCDISCVKVPTMLCSSFIDRCCFETFWFWFAHWSKLASLP